MLQLPLPFTAALLAGLVAAMLWADRGAGRRAKLLFALFFATVGVLAVLAGVRYADHDKLAALAQPVLAMTPAPLSWLAFQALTDSKPEPAARVLARHFWPVPLAALLLWLGSPPIGLAIIASFVTYAVKLARLRARGPDVFVEVALGDSDRTMAMLTVTILLHLASAGVDLAVLVAFVSGAPGTADAILAWASATLIIPLGALLLVRPAPQPAAAAPPAPDPATAEDAALLAALEALLARQHLYRDPALTIARLARRAGVPARRVSQAVNRARGLNVSQFINNHRVAEAARLLRETPMPVTEVMLAAGFQTKSNFNREFRRVTGGSPSALRQSAGVAPG